MPIRASWMMLALSFFFARGFMNDLPKSFLAHFSTYRGVKNKFGYPELFCLLAIRIRKFLWFPRNFDRTRNMGSRLRLGSGFETYF